MPSGLSGQWSAEAEGTAGVGPSRWHLASRAGAGVQQQWLDGGWQELRGLRQVTTGGPGEATEAPCPLPGTSAGATSTELQTPSGPCPKPRPGRETWPLPHQANKGEGTVWTQTRSRIPNQMGLSFVTQKRPEGHGSGQDTRVPTRQQKWRLGENGPASRSRPRESSLPTETRAEASEGTHATRGDRVTADGADA